jgi:putative cell wall-binding protein
MFIRRTLSSMLAAALVAASVLVPSAPTAVAIAPTAEVPYVQDLAFPAVAQHLYDAKDVAALPDGDVLVADKGYRRVLRYSSTGALETSYSVAASDAPWLDYPIGVAAAPDGGFYVALDDGLHDTVRFVRCAADGTVMTSWDPRGNGPGLLPAGWSGGGMSCDASGNLYVTDAPTGCVNRYSPDGAYLDRLDATDSGFEGMAAPTDVAVDSSGTVWVAAGATLRSVRSDGVTFTLDATSSITALATGGGRVYYTGNLEVWAYVPYSTHTWRASGVAASALTCTGGTRVLALESSGSADRVVGLDVGTGATVDSWRSWDSTGAGLYNAIDMAVGPDGTTYVLSADYPTRVTRFNAAGAFVAATEHGTSEDPDAIEVDASGTVYLLCSNAGTVERYNGAMGYLGSFPVDVWWQGGSMAVDASGTVFVSNHDSDVVTAYQGGLEVTSWPAPGVAEMEASRLQTGTVWVSDGSRTAQHALGGAPTGRAVPASGVLAVDADDRLVFARSEMTLEFSVPGGPAQERRVNRMLRYNRDGSGPVYFGGLGYGPGEFAAISGAAFGPSGSPVAGRLYTVDYFDSRIQRWAPLADSAPPVTMERFPSDNWFPWAVSVELTATDGNSGVAYTRYRLSGATTQAETTYTAGGHGFEITNEGETQVHYYSVDASGHVEASHTAYARRDFTPPTMTASVSAGQVLSGASTVTVDASDPLAGVRWLEWALVPAGSSVTTYTRVDATSAAVPVAKPGVWDLYYRSMDRAVGSQGDGNTQASPYSVRFTMQPARTSIAGSTRFATAVEMSKLMYPSGCDAVIIASGRGYADALGAAALAGAYDAPLLLVEPGSIPASVAAEIERLDPSSAKIIGGTGAVSSSVASELAELSSGIATTRLAGANRYKTARTVFEAVKQRYAETTRTLDGTVFVVSGENYPDALAASALAAAKGWPILLTQANTLPVDTRAVLQDPAVRSAYVVGGTAAVSDGVLGAVRGELGSDQATRVAGATRYATALQVAALAESNGLSWEGVCISTGESYADALAGGPFAARFGTFVTLTPSASLDLGLGARLSAKRPAGVRFLGGTGAVSQTVRDQVLAAIMP